MRVRRDARNSLFRALNRENNREFLFIPSIRGWMRQDFLLCINRIKPDSLLWDNRENRARNRESLARSREMTRFLRCEGEAPAVERHSPSS